MPSRSFPAIAARAALCLTAGACSGQTFKPHGGPFYQPPSITPVSTGTGGSAGSGGDCTMARSSEPLVPRVDLTGMTASTVGGQDVAYTNDLFGTFYAFCGGCHVDGAQGNPPRHIDKNVSSFVAVFDQSWLAPVLLDAPNADNPMLMPPPGKPWSDRTPGDPIVDFVKHAQSWLSAGKPTGVYAVDNGSGGGSTSAMANYTFTPTVAAAMTNIGNCVPTSALFASSTSDVMTSMDEFFAGATGLPNTLAETDLTTLDSEELAKTAVIAYAPTYALWSAGSGKLRHIRVPRGTSVQFDKQTQTWTIPDNTRFYKTFFRKVKDRTGAPTWRKMETRVIVARADDTDPATGAARQNALFGTYIWSEDETTASLATQPYRDQTSWADIIRVYITDELLYQDIIDSTTGSIDVAVARAIQSHQSDPAYRDLLQHYAIPGRLRCIQCHMGSPTKNFALGFLPLQIKRRETGTGGTYDTTGADELSQLQRLIDVGVITGISSPDDVKPLEESQGARKPRKTASADGDVMTDDGELKAQAYMLGNCAHCHNPRGFPSVTKPELAPVLNFLPDGKDGGVFQFPFEKYSPIRSRGANGDIPIPYITPSLRDYPVATADGTARLDTGQSLVSGETGALTYTPKFPPNDRASRISCAESDTTADFRAYCGDRKTGSTFVSAPWRALIYRNVDTPASYFDDYVPFPHMPMNTAGYDCRVPRIMGDWMAGLPSIRKLAYLAKLLGGAPVPSEDALFEGSPNPGKDNRAPVLGSLNTGYDDNPQPYIEVPPDSDLYAQALIDARARLVEYHQGVRYQYCQDVISPDIYDPFVPVNPQAPYPYHPDPYQYQLSYLEDPPLDPQHPDRFVQPRIGVPFHAHWYGYDPTDPPPPWVPRRTDWQDVLVNRIPDTTVPVGSLPLDQLEALHPDDAEAFKRGRANVVEALNEAPLSQQLYDYATGQQPYGLWKAKPECQQKLASQQTVAQIGADQRPIWFDVAKPDPSAPVYMLSPGAAIYRHICINCHGPNADGKGLQVDLLAATSEGEARPANFRAGLFGPTEQPLSNILATFDVAHTGDMTAAAQWGSRYMAWMALGGTLKRIPQDILQLVAATPILGVRRHDLASLPGSTDPTGNMLNLAKGFCAITLPDPVDPYLAAFHQFGTISSPQYPPYNYSGSPLVPTNYDKEMWIHLCSDFSPQVVRVYGAFNPPTANGNQTIELLQMYYAFDSTDPTRNYPASAEVWDQNKQRKVGVTSDNLYPACLDPDQIPADSIAQLGVPVCPPAFLAGAQPLWRHPGLVKRFPKDDQQVFSDNVAVWKLRGAIATGMSVFSYLEHRVTHPEEAMLPPYFDQCELLP